MSFDTRHEYASLLVVLNILSLLSLEAVINDNGIIIATGYEWFGDASGVNTKFIAKYSCCPHNCKMVISRR